MKKFLAGLVILFVFMITVPLNADAQSRCGCRSYSSRSYNRNYSRANYRRSYRTSRNVNRYNSYNNARYRTYSTRSYVYQRPSFYRRHRNLINLGIATGGGTLIGALVGGKRGAGIGALIGAGSGALYTYGINKKKRRYYR
jgi:hypothetical protein